MKELVGQEIAKRVVSGETIGVGTGTTVDAALVALADRVKREQISFYAVPTSIETSLRCEALGIPQRPLLTVATLSWGFDGADAVDPSFRAIKGKGGALLREKILACKCTRFVLLIDESKEVKSLSGLPIPVEVVPEAVSFVEKELSSLGAERLSLRTGSGKHGPVITESGNIILDAIFMKVDDKLERKIKEIVGVVESGLFTDYADEILVATKSGVVSRGAKPV